MCSKTRFSTEASAWRALDRIEHKPRVIGQKVPVRAYRCRGCRGWHLTSQALRKRA